MINNIFIYHLNKEVKQSIEHLQWNLPRIFLERYRFDTDTDKRID